MKKGISLVALVITIIVMIILTTAVILSVSNGGIIERAEYAKYMSDWRTFQDDLTLKLMNDKLNFQYDGPVNVIYDENPTDHYIRMKDQIASFTEKYKDEFEIRNDEVVKIQHVEPVEEVIGDISEWETRDNGYGTLTITKYRGTKTSDITVPNTLVINGENVTVSNVGNGISSVFKDKNITGILTISDGIVLNSSCFSSETGLTGITGTLGDVGYQAFYNCTGLTGTVNFKNGATVGNAAFRDCTGLTGITGTLGDVRMQAFYNCTGLTGITGKLGDVGSTAFVFTGLTGTVNFEDGATVGTNAFYGCTSLTGIVGKLGDVGNAAFRDCTGLTGTVNFENGATVGNYAFMDCTGLTGTVNFENEVTVRNSAFANCTSANITFKGTPSSIGTSAFYGCASVTVDNATTEQMVRDSGYTGTILHSTNYID